MDPQPPKLTRAIRKNRQLHPCPQCHKTFTKRSNMLIHARLHTGETPYVCKYAGCGKSYKWLSSINFHEGRCEKKSAGLAVPAPIPPPPPAQAEAQRVARARAAVPPVPDLTLARPDMNDRLLPHVLSALPNPHMAATATATAAAAAAAAASVATHDPNNPNRPTHLPPNPPLPTMPPPPHPTLAFPPALPSYSALQAHAAGASTPPPLHPPHAYTGYSSSQAHSQTQTNASYSHGHGSSYGNTYSDHNRGAGGAHERSAGAGAAIGTASAIAAPAPFHTPRKAKREKDTLAMPLSPVTPYAAAAAGATVLAPQAVPALPSLKPLTERRDYSRMVKRVKADGTATVEAVSSATGGTATVASGAQPRMNFASLRNFKRSRTLGMQQAAAAAAAAAAAINANGGGAAQNKARANAPRSPDSVGTEGVRDALAPAVVNNSLVDARCAVTDLDTLGDSFGMPEELFQANVSIVGNVFDELATDEYAINLDHCSPESESLSMF